MNPKTHTPARRFLTLTLSPPSPVASFEVAAAGALFCVWTAGPIFHTAARRLAGTDYHNGRSHQPKSWALSPPDPPSLPHPPLPSRSSPLTRGAMWLSVFHDEAPMYTHHSSVKSAAVARAGAFGPPSSPP